MTFSFVAVCIASGVLFGVPVGIWLGFGWSSCLRDFESPSDDEPLD